MSEKIRTIIIFWIIFAINLFELDFCVIILSCLEVSFVLCCGILFLFVMHMYKTRVTQCLFLSAVDYTTKLQRERHTMQEEAEMLRKQIQELNTSIRCVIILLLRCQTQPHILNKCSYKTSIVDMR